MKRLALVAPLALALLLGGCAPTPAPPGPEESDRVTLEQVKAETEAVAEQVVEKFGDAVAMDAATNSFSVVCRDSPDSERLQLTQAFKTSEADSGIAAVREQFADLETSFGTDKQVLTLGDSNVEVPDNHLVLESGEAYWLITWGDAAPTTVLLTMRTACGAADEG